MHNERKKKYRTKKFKAIDNYGKQLAFIHSRMQFYKFSKYI